MLITSAIKSKRISCKMLIAPKAVNATLITLSRASRVHWVKRPEFSAKLLADVYRQSSGGNFDTENSIPSSRAVNLREALSSVFLSPSIFNADRTTSSERRCFRRRLCAGVAFKANVLWGESSGCQFSLLLLVFVYILHFPLAACTPTRDEQPKLKDFP